MTTPNTKMHAKETLGFQAEVRELLKLMIHSLYSHREIFLRELISNASDANDKLRFEALASRSCWQASAELAITIEADAAKAHPDHRDNGIGMSREEAISHLGTIAKSGTADSSRSSRATRKKTRSSSASSASASIPPSSSPSASKCSRAAPGLPAGEGVRWESEADGEFTVETVERAERGTTIVLHLKEDAKEFVDAWRLRSLVRRYSDHIAFPVRMPKEGAATLEYEAVNRGTALWARPRARSRTRNTWSSIVTSPTTPASR